MSIKKREEILRQINELDDLWWAMLESAVVNKDKGLASTLMKLRDEWSSIFYKIAEHWGKMKVDEA